RGSLLHCLRGQNPQSPARNRVAVPGARLHEMFGLEGVQLAEYGRVLGNCLLCVAYEGGGQEVTVPPGGNTLLSAGDMLIIADDPDPTAHITGMAMARKKAA
ncbi:MAG: hypothetical protein ACI9X4_002588, partial [Glaciecola sp.]